MRLKLLAFFLCLLFALPLSAQDSAPNAVSTARTHVVQPGETLFRIALNYDVNIDTLASANNIVNTWQINAGQALIIPGEPAESIEVASADVFAAATQPIYHTIGRGETLAQIARLYGLTTTELAQMNAILNPNLIYVGQELVVGTQAETVADTAAAVTAAEAAAPPTDSATSPYFDAPTDLAGLLEQPAPPVVYTSHTITAGETLLVIARRYGVAVEDIAAANDLTNPDRVLVGQRLAIPTVGMSAPSRAPFDLSFTHTTFVPYAPPSTRSAGREIIVDISDARIYAYEDGQLVHTVVVSTGLPATPTVQGSFTVQRKYDAQTMAGPGYYLPDVPWVMYFYAGYAIHGTYWHANFGEPMSHGCVNLPTPEAEWFYRFAEVGTPVLVQA
ncbi:MAG: LysM peptidoglycan-binding domain-containing protein [Chloroflexi bacterium]|nr:LysM peptidoglycan-binding domain-containing protein [Chloroflexota bacterium]